MIPASRMLRLTQSGHCIAAYFCIEQDKNDPSHTVSCSPDNFPTAQFIADYADRYADWNPLPPADVVLENDMLNEPTPEVIRIDHTIMVLLVRAHLVNECIELMYLLDLGVQAAVIALAVMCLGLYLRTLWQSMQIFVVRRRRNSGTHSNRGNNRSAENAGTAVGDNTYIPNERTLLL